MKVSHIANYYSKPVAPQMLSFKEVDEPYTFKPQKSQFEQAVDKLNL